jgi:recombinational DNA repair protein (RecF pathway)
MKRSAIITATIILLLSAFVFAAPRCSLCGKTISGGYTKYDDGDIFCDNCVRTKPQCDLCGRPSLSLVTTGGTHICTKCLIHTNRCGICGQPITGKYVTYPELNLIVCSNCAQKIPKCDICGRPDKNLTSVGSKKLCAKCLAQAPVCAVCGEPITAGYVWFDNNRQKKYCVACTKKYAHCADCDAPVGPFGVTLADGRVLCPECYKTALFNAEQISPIKQQILGYFKSSLNMNIQHKVNYFLQGEDFLKTKSIGIQGDLNGLFFREQEQFNVYVLYGLRQNELVQVLSHEIAHAWASETYGRDLSLQTSEGFAQWVSYKTLGDFGYDDFRQTLLTGDDMYAIGLRKMLNIENSSGQAGVFNYIKKQ